MPRKILNRSRFVFAVFALVLTLAGVAYQVTTVDALPSNEVEWEYFSDPARTNHVGWKLLSCQGGYEGWGIQTPYYNRYQTPCNP